MMDAPLFGTAGIRGDVSTRVTAQLMRDVGRALSAQFSPQPVICGRDARLSGPYLSSALAASLMECGTPVLDAGVVPSPLLAFATWEKRLPGVMITASHNPPTDNGVKVFDEGYEVGRAVEQSIERYVSHPPNSVSHQPATIRGIDVVPSYMRHVRSYASSLFPSTSLGGMSILLDGGNGVGTSLLSSLLGSMGATVHTCNSHESGLFPGRPSEPSPEHIAHTIDVAESLEPDLIFAQDGDADRLTVFTPDGKVVPEDTLLAAFSRFYSKDGDSVVLSIDTSYRTDMVLTPRNVRVHRVPLGYLHDGIRLHNPAFAGEPWKHIHLGSGPWIDGILSGVIISHAISSLGWDSFFGGIPEYPYRKRALKLNSREEAQAAVGKIKADAGVGGDIESIDETSGVRLNYRDGSWVLVRPSGTEPKLRVIVEGTSQKRFIQLNELVDSILGDE